MVSSPFLSLWSVEKPKALTGEHGGNPKSIDFFDKLGLDYVSCSPFRVPVARLVTGQAAVKRKGGSCDVDRL